MSERRSNLLSKLFLAAGAAGLAGLAVIAMASAPAASFEVSSGTPAAGAPAQFTDTSTGDPTSWSWTFGDGSGSTLQHPAHVYPAAGVYAVTLQVGGPNGSSQTSMTLEVVDSSILRLLARTGHPFEATLEATDPSTGDTGLAQAVPQSDLFGYFAIPSLRPDMSFGRLTPEVFVKMEGARAAGADSWAFWGGLTELSYTLTIRDTATGATKVKRCAAADGPSCMGAVTGFLAAAATHTVNVGQGGTQFVDSDGGGKTTRIRVGETVEWSWVSSTQHSTTAGQCKAQGGYYGGVDCTESGDWNSGTHNEPYHYTRTFTEPGSYPYYCAIHGQAMIGMVIVSSDDTPTPTVTPASGPTPTLPAGPVPRQIGNVVSETRTLHPHIVSRPAPSGPPIPTQTPTGSGPTPTPTPTQQATPTRTPTGSSPQIRMVAVRDIFFRDEVSNTSSTTIDAGTTVRWQWQASISHSTTSGTCSPCNGDGKWNSTIKGSGTFDHTFTDADRGHSFPYFCLVHGSMMTGTVNVNP